MRQSTANLITNMYKRFLNNDDYLGIVTEEALDQLIRGNEIRLAQAEEAAEESVLEYLTENYEVEKALEIGKRLQEYNYQITYPAGAHFYVGNKIYKATRVINGRKSPSLLKYWVEVEDFVKDEDLIPFYTQRGTYMPGDVVRFANRVYQCLEYNGIDYNDVRVPGSFGWQNINVDEWIVNQTYLPWDVVSYEDKFYALLTIENVNWNLNPNDSDNWGLIGEYDSELNNYELTSTEFVVKNGTVFFPIVNPNSDELKEGYNIVLDDPRHPNLKKHILRLAVYELYKLISPTNISSTRITDYETSIMWLRDASRLKINPQIPRKLDEQNKPVADFATATYMRDYDPYKNPWQI